MEPFIFISIPRCASSTIHRYLGLRRAKNRSLPGDWGIMDNHAPCEVVRERYGAEEFGRRFKFSFVRNPWDRCVSWYHFHQRHPAYRDLSFKDWVRAGLPHHWLAQNDTFYGRQRSPLEQHLFLAGARGELAVDVVGRVEHFADDMMTIATRIGLTGPLPALRLKRSDREPDYHTYYDDDTAERVGALLETDVRMFEYRF